MLIFHQDVFLSLFFLHLFFTAAVRNSKITVVNIGVKAGIYVSQVHKKKMEAFYYLTHIFC